MKSQPVNSPLESESFVSRLEKLFDRFAYPLRASHYLELVNPLWARHKLLAKVVAVWDETKNTRTLTLKPGSNWRRHRAGQHIRIGVHLDGQYFTRTYTISSPPERKDRCITITIKAIDDGRVSHHLVRKMKVGAYLQVGLPQGEFYIPDAQPIRPLFITAGSGITPAISMVRSLLAQGKLKDCVHIHYSSDAKDMSFYQELKSLSEENSNYHLHTVFTNDYGALKKEKAYFSDQRLQQMCADWRQRVTYACGPQSLLFDIETYYKQQDMQKFLLIERFRAPLAEIPVDAVGGSVHFVKSDLSVVANPQENLLRIAEDAGINPVHGCRMGICHTCNVRLISGCVRDLRTGQLHSEPDSIVQICICAAAGDCTFDL